MQVGEYEILPVIDGSLKVPARLFFPRTTEEDWVPHRRFLTDDGVLDMAVGGFLVRGRGSLALVDTGVGPVESGIFSAGTFIDELRAIGHEPGDITDVLFSHLHFDHIGWTTQDGKPLFPNATLRCHEKDWEHFITHNTHQGPITESLGLSPFAESWLGPVADRFEMWGGDANVLPGIDVRDAPGHTPGSTVIVVSSGTERALLLGDAVHCPAELLEPEWELLGDVDPDLARRTREALAREFEGTGIPIAAPHFPEMRFGRLLTAEGRLSWVFD